MTDHQPPPAVEAIGRLEELARRCTEGDPWYTADDLRNNPFRHLIPQDRAFIAAANPQAILSLIEALRGALLTASQYRGQAERAAQDRDAAEEALRHSVEREAGLAEALEPFADCTKYTGEHDGDDEHPSWSPFIPVSAYRKARAALDRRAGDA